jgi:hypothetical protein
MHGEAGLDANARQERQEPFDFFRQFGFGSFRVTLAHEQEQVWTPKQSGSSWLR